MKRGRSDARDASRQDSLCRPSGLCLRTIAWWGVGGGWSSCTEETDARHVPLVAHRELAHYLRRRTNGKVVRCAMAIAWAFVASLVQRIEW